MPNVANVNFNVTNVVQNVSTPAKGITYMMGQTLIGSPSNPDTVITSWSAFKKAFGGLMDSDDFPLECKRALDGGAKLRVSRLVHYTDPGDNTSNDGDIANLGAFLYLSFSAVLITGNVVNLSIGGVAIDAVTFAVSHNNTMDLLAAELMEHPAIKTAYKRISGSNLVIECSLVTTDSLPAVTGFAVTGGASQATADFEYLQEGFKNLKSEQLFTFHSKYQGAGYNRFRVAITDASNGQANYFNLTVYNQDDPSVIYETYTNLVIPAGGQAIVDSNYLDEITNNSKYIVPEYFNTTTVTGDMFPAKSDQMMSDGTDGSALTTSDYVGDSAGETGAHAFDGYEDGLQIMIPTINFSDVHVGLAAYVINRADLQYDAWIGTDEDAATVVSEKVALNIDSKFVNFYYGLIEIIHPVSGNKVTISPMGDIAAAISRSDSNYGEWWSYAGAVRGVMPNITKVMNNFGSVGKKDQLQLLAQNQINAVILRDQKVMISGNFTAQILDNTEKFTNVERLVLYLQKALKPVLETFLEDPNDPITWKRMYYTVKPFLDDLLTQRAYYGYEWQGDQNVSNVNDVVINDPGEVSNGKYKVNLIVAPIPSLQEISINIILTDAGVSFSSGINQQA